MNRFIVLDQINPGFSASISLHCCQFSAAEYTDSLFQQHNIHRPMELERAVIKRKAEFFAGRYCGKKSLGLLDGTIADIYIGKNRNPIWPNHIVGSISHSNSHAVAATALKSTIRGIGVDIQDEIGADTQLKIESLIVFEDEYKNVFQSNKNLTEQETFTIAFSVKESFFKAAFAEVGRFFDFSCISIMKIDQKRQLISMKLNENLSENLKAGGCVQADYRILPEKKIITLVRLS
jgi:4'-phosphopantetheinyl transferase EntD